VRGLGAEDGAEAVREAAALVADLFLRADVLLRLGVGYPLMFYLGRIA
jgi:hypothetical protein